MNRYSNIFKNFISKKIFDEIRFLYNHFLHDKFYVLNWYLNDLLILNETEKLDNQRQTSMNSFILFSNKYSSSNKSKQKIKDFEKSITKTGDELVKFTSDEPPQVQFEEIYAELDRMEIEIIKDSHNLPSNWISRKIRKDKTIGSDASGHAERLALAFNFIEKPNTNFIQITVNIRMCADCHQFMKQVAKLRQCKIIIRDANCIHHFNTNGECSCKDHF